MNSLFVFLKRLFWIEDEQQTDPIAISFPLEEEKSTMVLSLPVGLAKNHPES